MKSVILTGGSKGLGKAIKDKLEHTYEPGFGGHSEQEYVVTDVSRTSGHDIIEMIPCYKDLDVLILNAGIWEGKDLFPLYEATKIMASTHLWKHPHIIFILSNAAYQNFGNDDYATVKAGLLLFARRLQKEGHKVSTISPGTMDCDNFWENAVLDHRNEGCMDPKTVASLVQQVIKAGEQGAIVTELIVLPERK